MLPPEASNSTVSATTKTLLYTISFVFLFLFMEYSLNYISSSTSSTLNDLKFNNNISNSNSNGLSLEDTSFSSLSSSLIEKEKLLIEKEEKYVVALQKLNERDLKLNYVDEQLYKLQSLVNKYKIHTKDLESKLFKLENKYNKSKRAMDSTHSKKGKEDEMNAMNAMNDDIFERVIKIGDYGDLDKKIIDKYEDEYILSNKKTALISSTQIVDFRLIWDLGIVLISATFGGILSSLFNQPLIFGYLLGGSFVGPGGLKLIQQYIQVETLAHIGSIFLLFNVGIDANYKLMMKIKKYLKHSILSLITCCSALYIMCYLWFIMVYNDDQFNIINISIFVFASLNTSTTVVLKTLNDLYSNNNDENTQIPESNNIIIAILLFQDICFIFFMAVFSSVTQQQENDNFIYKLLMVLIIICIFFKILPNLLSYLRRSISIDIYILFTISLCIIFTLITQNLFESSGLGAFTAGLLISKSNVDNDSNEKNYKLLKKNWEPIRNIFGVLFYASIGMLINPVFLWINWKSICTLVLFIGFAKFVMIYLSVYFLENKNINFAVNVSTSLCLQGEFAFVLSSHSHLDELITMSMHTALIGSTAVSILITPFLIRHFTAYFLQIYCWINGKNIKKTFKS